METGAGDAEQTLQKRGEMNRAGAIWWGPLEVPCKSVHVLEIGPLELQVERHDREWRIRHREYLREDLQQPDGRLPTQSVRPVRSLGEPPVETWERILRIGMDTAAEPLELVAQTADRPIVTVPADPFLIPPRGQVLLFVSTPLWIAIECRNQRLFEVPIGRPSDTWVGARTGPGQAAYANRTQCRQELDEVPFRPHRALSPLHVSNRSSRALPLERVVIAMPYLSLYADDDQTIWTERVDVTIDDDKTISAIRPGAPEQAASARTLSARRTAPPSGRLGQMLASVF